MSSSQLRLDWCNYKAALYACRHWHYSGTIPASKRASLGVWEEGSFVGAIIFTLGSGNSTDGRSFGISRFFEMAELQRVALREHQTPVSRMLSIAVRMLSKQSPGLKLLVSYADPSMGHHGGIYQAAGWVYVGRSGESTVYIAKDGTRYNSRVISLKGYKLNYGKYFLNPVPYNELTKTIAPAKHKYLLPLDPATRLVIEAMAQAYPMRPKDSSEPLGSPAERGRGSTDPDAPNNRQGDTR